MQPCRPSFRYAVLLAVALLASLSVFGGQTLTLAWDASPDTNVVGYYLYYGPAAGNYTNRLDAGTSLTVTTPLLDPGIYYFSATSRDALGVESEFATFVNVTIAVPDTTPPTVVTTWPKTNYAVPNGQECVNGSFVTTAPDVPLSGGASDNVAIANVTVTRIVPSWAPLTFSPTLIGSDASTAWTNVVTLVDGTNTFQIVATDSAGLTTTLLRTIFLRTTNELTVATNGNGSTAPTGVLTYGAARNGASLQNGRNYSIKATPKAGNWFVDWTDGSGAILGTNAILTFRMTNGLSLTANFATNAIVAYHLAGAYSGLFAEDAGVSTQSAGSISGLSVTSSRSYSGKLFVGGASYSFAGTFGPMGNASKTILRKSKSSIVLSMQMDFISGANQITGTVSCPGESWSSPLRANLGYFSTANPSPMARRYTLALPPSDTLSSDSPIGYGYGLITNAPTGATSMTGALADLTAIKCSAPVAQNGDWPVCVDLYSHQGLLFGWLNFSSGAPAGRLSWIKPAQPATANTVSKALVTGVNTSIDVFGSVYQPSLPALPSSSGKLEVDLGATSLATYSVAVTDNTITSPNSIKGTVAPSTGLLTLTLPPTVAGGVTRAAYAVVLQSSNAAVGTVSGINGAVYLQTRTVTVPSVP